MKPLLLLLLFCIGMSCKQEKTEQQVDKATIEIANVDEKVNTLLDNWHLAAAEADEDAYFGKLTEKSIFIGTQEDEVWDKAAFYSFSKPYFDKGKAWDFKARYRNIYQKNNGQTVWFDELLDTWMGECRGSGVLSWNPESQAYFIDHYVLSLTVPNDKINNVIRAIGMVELKD